jgi:EAL domain-containing protein (putative c-di-GMP-specific phosphodiesterase class I)
MERRSLTPGATRKREAIRRLKDGLEQQLFVLHYQPVVEARDESVASVEALLRWRQAPAQDPDLEDLIWSVERSPVIVRLENWTLQHACADAVAWAEEGLDRLRVDVNLSAKEFPRTDLVRRVRRRLADCGLPPSRLGLEITETSGLREFDVVAEQIERLMALGIELWLDDFGTGHSSLEWLRHLPRTGVKIPGAFVEGLPEETRSQAIVARVIDLAHDLGLRVVAEEVETEAQRDFLAGHGCDLYQGFLFYAAMPAGELVRALAATAGARAATRS